MMDEIMRQEERILIKAIPHKSHNPHYTTGAK